MKSNETLQTKTFAKFHYLMIGSNFKKVLSKLDDKLHFYRFISMGRFKGEETIYDVASNMLSNAGLVISKQSDADGTFFKVRKISNLPTSFKRPAQKFNLGQCEGNEEPKNFPIQISNAISNSFANPFTIDLVTVVRQTMPKISIIVTGTKYKIVSGDGYEGYVLFEKAVYRDIQTKKKVVRLGVTFKLPKEEDMEKGNREILYAIEHYCKELVHNESSRFEIAQRLLYPKPFVDDNSDEKEEED